jgi:hypothetical protein
MDIEALKARTLAARQFTVPCGSRSYTLQLPTAHELEVAAARRTDGAAGTVEFFRHAIERALVGWSGITEASFAGEGDSAVPFSAELVPWLLDAQPADAEQLRSALVDRLTERRERMEAAAKN